MANNGFGKAHLWLATSGVVARMTPSTAKVLLSLICHANPDGECWPSRRTICHETGVGKSTFATAVRELTRLGLVRVTSSYTLPNFYSLTFDYDEAVLLAKEQGYPPPGLSPRRPSKGRH